ncbi:MAG: sterol desaturase family protein [Sandarakinorhabdus sp.]|nr:sterol desaturase family protein [Sandarakinorhabdus sp.]
MNLLASLPAPIAGFAVDVLRLCLWLVILTALFVPLERLFAQRSAKLLRPQIGNDLFYYFFSSLLPAVLLAPPLAVLAIAVRHIMPADFLAAMRGLPLWIGLPLGLLVADIGSYWGHRFSHEWPLLWRFHKLHHSAEHLDFLVNGRAHPVDLVWVRLWGLVPLYMLGLGNAGAAGSMVPVVVTLVGTVMSFFVHANVRWRLGPVESLVATPAFHHWHHSRTDHIDHNYAATFPFLDRAFGTLYLPGHFPTDYGIVEILPQTIAGQMLGPFELQRPPVAVD